MNVGKIAVTSNIIAEHGKEKHVMKTIFIIFEQIKIKFCHSILIPPIIDIDKNTEVIPIFEHSGNQH